VGFVARHHRILEATAHTAVFGLAHHIAALPARTQFAPSIGTFEPIGQRPQRLAQCRIELRRQPRRRVVDAAQRIACQQRLAPFGYLQPCHPFIDAIAYPPQAALLLQRDQGLAGRTLCRTQKYRQGAWCP